MDPCLQIQGRGIDAKIGREPAEIRRLGLTTRCVPYLRHPLVVRRTERYPHRPLEVFRCVGDGQADVATDEEVFSIDFAPLAPEDRATVTLGRWDGIPVEW